MTASVEATISSNREMCLFRFNISNTTDKDIYALSALILSLNQFYEIAPKLPAQNTISIVTPVWFSSLNIRQTGNYLFPISLAYKTPQNETVAIPLLANFTNPPGPPTALSLIIDGPDPIEIINDRIVHARVTNVSKTPVRVEYIFPLTSEEIPFLIKDAQVPFMLEPNETRKFQIKLHNSSKSPRKTLIPLKIIALGTIGTQHYAETTSTNIRINEGAISALKTLKIILFIILFLLLIRVTLKRRAHMLDGTRAP